MDSIRHKTYFFYELPRITSFPRRRLLLKTDRSVRWVVLGASSEEPIKLVPFFKKNNEPKKLMTQEMTRLARLARPGLQTQAQV